jgi:hypothetical protein
MFGVPIDSETIQNINPAQMIWYALMFNQEREESFDAELNMTEYLASFINSEAVRQTRDSRENKKIVSDEDFESGLRARYGRDLPADAMANATRAAEDETPKIIGPQKRKGEISIDDIRKYTGLKLDEVKYTPHKK